MSMPLVGSIALAIALGFAGTGARAAGAVPPSDECADLGAAFERAIAAKSYDGEKKAFDAIAEDIVCGALAGEFIRTYVDATLDLLEDPKVSPADQQKAMDYVIHVLPVSGTWRNAERLGDYWATRKDYGNASAWYDKAISFLASRPTERATRDDVRGLRARDGAAKILASLFEEGAPMKSPENCRCRGCGIAIPVLPVPIEFGAGEADLNDFGTRAVEALAEAVKVKGVHNVTLVGHADPRGVGQRNLALSRWRAQTVRRYLLRFGVRAKVDIEAKGADEPFDVSSLGWPVNQDEAWALDRRVEWVRDSTER